MLIKTSIIPEKQTFVKVKSSNELDLEAICVFVAIGFFLDDDTYWKNKKVLTPGSNNFIDENGFLINSKPWFKWHYSPREITFNEALDEFSELFETIIKEQTSEKKVILPLSGGLDSRTQATALKALNAEVYSYSYEFKNGFAETKIASQVAKTCSFDFEPFKIDKGYLWNVLDDLSELNQFYSDFTSPRQMAVVNQLSAKGDVFSLGHWGDVLFDSMNLPDLTEGQQIEVLVKKLIKRGGLELAKALWNIWGLNGDFEFYFRERLKVLLQGITIDNTNAKLRAFKSLYWAPRWTSINLSVFESVQPITLPYYDDRMCEFICTLPEAYLENRQLQIAYIKKRNPELAKITWQDQRPFNLNTYLYNKFPYNIAYKFVNKLRYELNSALGQTYVQRNWELQFLGVTNKVKLRESMFDSGLSDWIPDSLLHDYFEAFYNKDALGNAHALNMLLVLSQFYKTSINA
jgi:hypothetical protein